MVLGGFLQGACLAGVQQCAGVEQRAAGGHGGCVCERMYSPRAHVGGWVLRDVHTGGCSGVGVAGVRQACVPSLGSRGRYAAGVWCSAYEFACNGASHA